MPPEKPHWAHLFSEVVTSGLCTGCAGCVAACPYDVLGYDHRSTYRPFHVEADGGAADCTHGQKGCTLCTRACPRFRSWEGEIDEKLFGRERSAEEVAGIFEDAYLIQATDPAFAAAGQDGGFVSALLAYCLDREIIDGALVSALAADGSDWQPQPRLVRTKDEVMATAGSRYTYSANPLAYAEAASAGCERLALVGMSCQASVPAVMAARKAGKIARRFVLTVGLLCSKTFDDRIFEELFAAQYGLARSDIARINIKGVFQIWMKDGAYHEVPLKEGHPYTRSGCLSCPDFAAQHADISAGGIGARSDRTLVLVRTERGREVVEAMATAGLIDVLAIDADPGALALARKLARVSRRRWPEWASPGPARIPPPKPKAIPAGQ
jgi:coenzyme F420 hydrogenase subunit beta